MSNEKLTVEDERIVEEMKTRVVEIVKENNDDAVSGTEKSKRLVSKKIISVLNEVMKDEDQEIDV